MHGHTGSPSGAIQVSSTTFTSLIESSSIPMESSFIDDLHGLGPTSVPDYALPAPAGPPSAGPSGDFNNHLNFEPFGSTQQYTQLEMVNDHVAPNYDNTLDDLNNIISIDEEEMLHASSIDWTKPGNVSDGLHTGNSHGEISDQYSPTLGDEVSTIPSFVEELDYLDVTSTAVAAEKSFQDIQRPVSDTPSHRAVPSTLSLRNVLTAGTKSERSQMTAVSKVEHGSSSRVRVLPPRVRALASSSTPSLPSSSNPVSSVALNVGAALKSPEDVISALGLSEEQLANLKSADVDKTFARFGSAAVQGVKRRRRTIKNRGYAQSSRQRKKVKDSSSSGEVGELQAEIERLQVLVNRYESTCTCGARGSATPVSSVANEMHLEARSTPHKYADFDAGHSAFSDYAVPSPGAALSYVKEERDFEQWLPDEHLHVY